jgi:hypothetical protein
MSLWTRLSDFEARGPGLIPRSTETRLDYLNRIGANRRGVLASAVSLLARELPDQRREIEELRARLAAMEARS